ncbi:MAG TPA: hypothetical protein VM618_08015, partial [Acidimicrobiia bacterium]|nr:hypothetical protein [Acidimicrobiia bacterium]
MDGTRGAGLRNEALTAVAVLAAVAVAVLSAIPGAATLSLAAQSAAALGAGVAGAVTARHSTGSARWAWRFIAAGACSWGAANVIWALTGEAQGGSALASLADLGFVALFPLAFVGLMFHPAAPRGTAGLTRLALDGLIAAGSLRLVAWLLFLEDAHDGSVGHQFQDAVGFAQAVGDFGLVTVAVLVAAGARRGRRTPLLLLAAGFAAVGVADGIFTFAVLDGTYASGDPVDLL